MQIVTWYGGTFCCNVQSMFINLLRALCSPLLCCMSADLILYLLLPMVPIDMTTMVLNHRTRTGILKRHIEGASRATPSALSQAVIPSAIKNGVNETCKRTKMERLRLVWSMDKCQSNSSKKASQKMPSPTRSWS